MNLLVASAAIQALVECQNGKEALEHLKMTSCDLILLDVMMPVMNGLEATKIIHNAHPHIMIIVVNLTTNRFIGQILNIK